MWTDSFAHRLRSIFSYGVNILDNFTEEGRVDPAEPENDIPQKKYQEVQTMAKTVIKKSFVVALFAAAGIALVLATAPSFAKGKMTPCVETSKAEALKLSFRNLWTDHVFWVRNLVLATKYKDQAAAKVAEDRIVQDAREIANAITPYYGKEASDKLYTLLGGHYAAIKDYMNAAFAGNKMAEQTASKLLKKNADEIAAFLSSANPNWSKATLEAALTAHVGQHMADINEIAKKEYAADAKTWEAMKGHVDMIAGVLSDGIVKQFPKKFIG